ncbi:hypothetical protein CYMTET_44670 [Cymbomonas tetramitiformis]|uniref:Uncharacterized protein n=1 Tax=Cymbomonas tetramitiformis TaxID=36881 RepID=A0AAE0C139_9CHLO|nr:hypothetical protein CYMTET_44670 [Cymbomonas tetramitiformis]
MFNPVTPQALVVVNGEFDTPGVLDREAHYKNVCRSEPETTFYRSTGDQNELFSLCKHDLCFREARSIRNRNRPITMNDNWLKVFSSFNHLPQWVPGGLFYETDPVAFVGVSQTQMLVDRAKSQSAGVVVATAGKLSVRNTGRFMIQPGDTVCWDFPDNGNINKMNNYMKRAKYNDGNRIIAATLPMQKLQDLLEKHYSLVASQHPTIIENYGGDISLKYPVIYARKRTMERIVGKATTRAMPDEPFDIQLQYAHG